MSIDIAALRKVYDEWSTQGLSDVDAHVYFATAVGPAIPELLDEIERLRQGEDEPSKEEFAVRIVTRRIAELEAALDSLSEYVLRDMHHDFARQTLIRLAQNARTVLEKKP